MVSIRNIHVIGNCVWTATRKITRARIILQQARQILEEFSFVATQITILGQVYRLKGPHEGQVWGTPEGRSG